MGNDKRTSWNKGMKMSVEHRYKISLSLIGNKRHFGCKNTEEVKRKMSLVHKGQKGYWKGKKFTNSHKSSLSASHLGINSGESHYRWKGGITPIDRKERIKFRNTIQKQVFERDNYTCQACGTKGKDMTVDHIQPWAEYIELRFNINNCRTLCIKCHYKITYGKPMLPTVKTWGHNLIYASQ